MECVPNFSEGRRKEVIDAIVAEARARKVKVLDIEIDADHNRSVLTFAGAPVAVKEAALAVSGKAIELIDLNKHQGQHPRMGAVDVVPFIPLADVTMDDCIKLAKEFAEEFAAKFKVPVYLYEEAATRPDRKSLADVRKGEFEGLREEIGKDPNRVPDYGPSEVHPTAGATAVGARKILIAYNINLGTTDVSVAKEIAKQIRGSDGGLTGVKALGFELKDRGFAQVSMNVTDHKTSQLFKVFELARSFAERYSVPVVNSEIVGLVPMDALTETADFYLKLHGFSRNQILEQRLIERDPYRLAELDLIAFADEVASDRAVPGSGSVSAYSAALASGLVSMVAQLTLVRKEVEAKWPVLKDIVLMSEAYQRELISLVDDDARSFMQLLEAYKMPKNSEDEKRKRTTEVQSRLKKAAEVPFSTAENSLAVLDLANRLSEDASINAISDLQTAIFLAHASALGALANVNINLKGISDEEYRAHMQAKVAEIQNQLDTSRSNSLGIIAKRSIS